MPDAKETVFPVMVSKRCVTLHQKGPKRSGFAITKPGTRMNGPAVSHSLLDISKVARRLPQRILACRPVSDANALSAQPSVFSSAIVVKPPVTIRQPECPWTQAHAQRIRQPLRQKINTRLAVGTHISPHVEELVRGDRLEKPCRQPS